MAVAAALARARHDQIAHAGQAREGVAVPARRLAHLGHLTQRAGHHHRAGVLADTHASSPSRQRSHRRSSTRPPSPRQPHHRWCTSEIAWCGTALRAGPPRCWSGIASTAAAAYPSATSRAMFGPARMPAGWPGQHLVDDLAHPVVGALLETLHQRHHRHPRPQLLGEFGQHAAEAVRRHAHHDHVGTISGLGEVGGGFQGVLPTRPHCRDISSCGGFR